ncbi:hypothetical protein KZJ38_25240 [Paraburkholderia edwinii]|uniref:EcsC family protein n=1 Tax=Paraburkholderia edwinii TaxID=2861782 RepID=A0ABX8V1L9_9BURK|nr:hypothetical protein [Paraburkholderia edwinii]QYD72985.1 hypothetical protein KZJ38_25240 [Paraburkholderia edwinii]
MCEKKGWSIPQIHSNAKRYFWFTPDYWASFKQGFVSPNIVTIQYLLELNKKTFPGFMNMFNAGVGYAVGGKSALTHSGVGYYLSRIPLVGPVAITRMDSEIKSGVAVQMGGMASAVLLKYVAMQSLGTLVRTALQSRFPGPCVSIVKALAYTNYANTLGGLVHMANHFNLIREQSIVKSFVKSCEDIGQGEMIKMLQSFTEHLNRDEQDL